MAGSCTIDGFDISGIGMFILRGGDNDLLAFPDRKEPQKNEWFEYDGVDADLSEIYFNAKKTTIKFYLKGDTSAQFLSYLETFQALLTNYGYRSVYVREFNKTFTLRYVSCPQFTVRGGLIKAGSTSTEITVEFSDDAPTAIFGVETTPVAAQPNDTYVYLNGIELKNFGITVKNIYDTALQPASVKQPLIQSSQYTTGVVADMSADPLDQTKKIIIECFMTADTLAHFYVNYNALFNQVSKVEALTLSFPVDKEINCYYSGMSNFEKLKPIVGNAAFQFSLMFVEI